MLRLRRRGIVGGFDEVELKTAVLTLDTVDVVALVAVDILLVRRLPVDLPVAGVVPVRTTRQQNHPLVVVVASRDDRRYVRTVVTDRLSRAHRHQFLRWRAQSRRSHFMQHVVVCLVQHQHQHQFSDVIISIIIALILLIDITTVIVTSSS